MNELEILKNSIKTFIAYQRQQIYYYLTEEKNLPALKILFESLKKNKQWLKELNEFDQVEIADSQQQVYIFDNSWQLRPDAS